MRRRRYLTEIGTVLSAGLAGLAGCGAPSDDAGTETQLTEETATTAGGETGTGTGAAERRPNEIEMITEGSDYVFDPIGLFVDSGETITWINESGAHSSTAYTEDNPQSEVDRIPEEAEGWNSGTLSEQGAEFTHSFEVPGTYDYYCIPHKSLGMVARIVVGEPGGVDGDPPDGPVPSEQTIVERGVVTQEEFSP